MLAWFAMPWRVTYRLGARIVLPIAARQPRLPLAVVVIAAFSLAIVTGVREHQWAGASMLAGLGFSTLTAPALELWADAPASTRLTSSQRTPATAMNSHEH